MTHESNMNPYPAVHLWLLPLWGCVCLRCCCSWRVSSTHSANPGGRCARCAAAGASSQHKSASAVINTTAPMAPCPCRLSSKPLSLRHGLLLTTWCRHPRCCAALSLAQRHAMWSRIPGTLSYTTDLLRCPAPGIVSPSFVLFFLPAGHPGLRPAWLQRAEPCCGSCRGCGRQQDHDGGPRHCGQH